MNAILYLRTQQLPGENSIADRIQWFELDLTLASSAATKCGMYKSALLFIELSSSEGLALLDVHPPFELKNLQICC